MKKWQYNIELPPQRTGKKEFPSGEKEFVSCPVCHSVYYKKSWHHAKRGLRDAQRPHRNKEMLCPACRMIKNKEFEGQLTVSGFPPEKQDELVKLAKNFGLRAFERDPLDRIIDIKTKAGFWS